MFFISNSLKMDLYNQISFKTSKLITRSYSTSFSMAVGLLSSETKKGIYSIYGFVRLADEIVDTFHQSNQSILLKKFEQDCLEAIASGISMNPVLHSFAITVRRYRIPIHLIDAFLRSMKADLEKSVYTHQGELNDYIYGSADVVGLMCLKVFVNGDEDRYLALEKPAMKLGSAFQKVNFLRDLKADFEGLDRTYFPGFTIQSFDEKTKENLIRNIEADFAEARDGIRKLPGRARLAVNVAFVFYLQLLRKLRKTPASSIVSTRLRVSDPKKLYLLGKAMVQYKLKLI